MSINQKPEKAEAIEALIKQICQLSLLTGESSAPGLFYSYSPLSIPEHGEMRFSFIVSWLYQLYREHGGEGLKYCNLKLKSSYPIEVSHYQLVDDFRTLKQHSIITHTKRSLEREARCKAWFVSVCAVTSQSFPESLEDWNISANALLQAGINYLSRIREILETFKSDSTGFLVKEFHMIRQRSIDHGDFDRWVAEIAADLGFSTLDVVKFRNTHHQTIIQDLRVQRWDIDITQFVRDRIASRMIIQYPKYAITVDELKAHGVKPGRMLGHALAVAEEIFRKSEFTMKKNDIISELRKRSLIPQ